MRWKLQIGQENELHRSHLMNIHTKNIPRTTLKPVEKYELLEDIRIHKEYVPATEPVSTTISVVSVDDEKAEVTLVTTLVGVPVHELDEIIKADESLDRSTNPAPFIMIV